LGKNLLKQIILILDTSLSLWGGSRPTPSTFCYNICNCQFGFMV
jgi:hypothetical protein